MVFSETGTDRSKDKGSRLLTWQKCVKILTSELTQLGLIRLPSLAYKIPLQVKWRFAVTWLIGTTNDF